MFNRIDLRKLAERQGPERAFLSLYLSGPDAMNSLGGRIQKVRALLSDNAAEREYFDENLQKARDALDRVTFDSEGLCLFTCWATDYLEVHKLEQKVPDLLWVDSSPYIRPLAELQDEYENFVVVAADNTDAHVYFVTSSVVDEEERVKGDVKNRVKKGGWSQQRYARRREKELHEYAKDVADVLHKLDEEVAFDRLYLLGSEEAMHEIEAVLSRPLAEKLGGKEAIDLSAENGEPWKEALGLFTQDERTSEEALWERIKGEYLRGGRAVAGPADVLEAAATGRVEKMIVTRDAKLAGRRCRDCENLSAGEADVCPVCGSADLFAVDLVNELVELLALSSAEPEFTDPIPGLGEVGDVAALLRY